MTGDDWVSALRLTDDRVSFVYATCLPAWTEEFDKFVAGADEVLLDGTFRHLNNTNPSVGDDIADDGSELFPGR